MTKEQMAAEVERIDAAIGEALARLWAADGRPPQVPVPAENDAQVQP